MVLNKSSLFPMHRVQLEEGAVITYPGHLVPAKRPHNIND